MPALRARIAELKAKYVDQHLAAERAEPLTYSADADDLAAFRLLAHAELEDYLERKARDALAKLNAEFKAGKNLVRDNLVLLVVARTLKTELRFDVAHWKDDCHKVLKDADEWISNNNGIKEASFTTLSIFMGYMPDEIDGGLAASLSSYGAARGDVAHKSVTRVRTINAPSVEAKNLDDLLIGLDSYFIQ